MGRLKEKKEECCRDCKKSFSDIDYHAINLCGPCYQRARNGTNAKRFNSRENYTHCRACNTKFGDLNDKGKVVKNQSAGYCTKCYSRAYYNRDGRTCKSCGKTMYNTVKELCQTCNEIKKEEFYKNNGCRKSDSYRERLKIVKTELTYTQFEEARRILGRFKLNYYNRVDVFRLIDIYVDIYTHESALDSLKEEDQILLMLKRLKEVWIYNKELIEKKRQIRKKQLKKFNI